MTETDDVDVDALERDIAQIKEAMGLHERYPTQFRLWLVYGLLVLLASFGSQAVVTFDLPGWGHAASWFGFMGLGALYSWYVGEDYNHPETGDDYPDTGVQFLGIAGYLVVVLAVVTPTLETLTPLEESATLFALVIGAVGATYVVQASTLKAYRIRARDRYTFYAGGLGMLAYAAVMVHVPLLLEWGYAIFGVGYAAYGIAAYMYLATEDGE
ncbi:hypothetical protein [Halopiger goleimassiliensis]|uniref:hypothetical protein n=1 Tax=Halopiger goleimassiliensis TaxID=1293048 RepID=UPI000677DA14|nr:hypothetical protein [Halopiger goleimassiliensis]